VEEGSFVLRMRLLMNQGYCQYGPRQSDQELSTVPEASIVWEQHILDDSGPVAEAVP
jgi:hypothetical protein